MGEYRVARAPVVLTMTGLGSCVALAFYVPRACWGALAHIMLPAPPSSARSSPARHARAAIDTLLRELGEAGFSRREVEVTVVGGARMLSVEGDWPRMGERNIAATLEGLQAAGMLVRAQDVGGTFSRSLEFDLETGKVWIRTPEGERVL